MKLNAPTQTVWAIAVVIAALSLLSHAGVISQFAPYQYWMMTAAFGLLTLATVLKGT